jgi:hypothetical protein
LRVVKRCNVARWTVDLVPGSAFPIEYANRSVSHWLLIRRILAQERIRHVNRQIARQWR